MLENIQKASSYLKNKCNIQAPIAIILGSGLSNLTQQFSIQQEIPYSQIPFFPLSTIKGHLGTLIYATINNQPIIILNGRFHYYEGYTMQQIAHPIRVLKKLGVKTLIQTNASGGINPNYQMGDLMLITDHINLLPTNPLIGKNLDEFGSRFPNMTNTYNTQLIKTALETAKENKIALHQGIYTGVTGPCYETPAEYKYLQTIGADAVGMSTIPEAITAHHTNIKNLAISVITNTPHTQQKSTHQEIIHIAQQNEQKLTTLITQVIKKITDIKNL